MQGLNCRAEGSSRIYGSPMRDKERSGPIIVRCCCAWMNMLGVEVRWIRFEVEHPDQSEMMLRRRA